MSCRQLRGPLLDACVVGLLAQYTPRAPCSRTDLRNRLRVKYGWSSFQEKDFGLCLRRLARRGLIAYVQARWPGWCVPPHGSLLK